MQGLQNVKSYDIRYIHGVGTNLTKAQSIRDSGSDLAIVEHAKAYEKMSTMTPFQFAY